MVWKEVQGGRCWDRSYQAWRGGKHWGGATGHAQAWLTRPEIRGADIFFTDVNTRLNSWSFLLITIVWIRTQIRWVSADISLQRVSARNSIMMIGTYVVRQVLMQVKSWLHILYESCTLKAIDYNFVI